MNLTIRPVDSAYIHQTWHLVKDYIAESLEKGMLNGMPDYTLDHIQAFLSSGQWVLLVAVDESNTIHGAMTVSFVNYPLNRIAFVTTTGGKLIINKDTFNQLQSIAKYHGATKIQAMARPAMVKLLQKCDMVPCNTMMEYKL